MCLDVIFTDSSVTNLIYRTSSNVQHITLNLTLPDGKPIYLPQFYVKCDSRVLVLLTYMLIELNTTKNGHIINFIWFLYYNI